jgi:Tol biopolymer transport system component
MPRIYAAILVAVVTGLGVAAEYPRSGMHPVWAGSDVNTLGAPSLDGRYLSCVDTKTGDLALRDLATGRQRRLTHKDPVQNKGEFAYFSVISPDGSQVAYAWFNDKKFYELRVVGTDGSKPRVLYRNEEAGFVQPSAWSPDGKQILTLLFRKDNISQITLVSAADGSVRVLKSLDWVYPKKMDFSPDGRYIVYDNFARDGSPARDIFVLSADGSREIRLVDDPANDLFPVWSPDGTRILFASDRTGTMDTWMIPVADGKGHGPPQLLKRDMGRFLPMGITRKGDYYYGLRTGRTDVYTASLDPGTGLPSGEASLASKRFPGVNSSPAWSPDGERIAFLSLRGSENFGQDSRVICIRSMKTGEERDVPAKLAHIETIRWFPDGRSLLASGSDRKSRGGLYRVDVETGKTVPVVQDPDATFRGLPGVPSADGKALYYLHDNEVRLRNLESGDERTLYRRGPAAHLRDIASSPDGRRLAFGDSASIFILTVGESPQPVRQLALPRGGALGGIAWFPNGTHLLVAREGEEAREIWRIPADGSRAEKMDLPISLQGRVSLRPDGRQIAFTAGQSRSEVWVVESILPPLHAAR